MHYSVTHDSVRTESRFDIFAQGTDITSARFARIHRSTTGWVVDGLDEVEPGNASVLRLSCSQCSVKNTPGGWLREGFWPIRHVGYSYLLFYVPPDRVPPPS